MFGMANKPTRPPWWSMFITLVLQSSLMVVVNGQQQEQQQQPQETTKHPGPLINPITVFTIGNSTVSSTVIGDPTTVAGTQQQHRQSEPFKIDEKLCQISDQSDQSSSVIGSNNSTYKLNVASNCKTLVHKNHHHGHHHHQQQQQNLDPQQSMVLEVFYNPNKNNNSSNNPIQQQSSPIRFQINSSANQTTSPFNLTNKIISPHSLNVKTSPNGEITVINGKTVTSILYEQDRTAIQKLVNAKLAQPPPSPTPPTTVLTTITKPDSTSTIAASSTSSTSSSTSMASTMAPESTNQKQSILIDHHQRSSSVPGATVHIKGDDNNAHNHNYNNAHNHKYNTKNNEQANINNSKYEMMFNRKNVHSYLNRVANQQQRSWALNSIQNHHQKHHLPQQAFGSKITGKPTMPPREGAEVTPSPADNDSRAPVENSTSNTPILTTVRDKNRIDYLRQRYNKSMAKMNQTTSATTTTTTTTTTPTMIATAASSTTRDDDDDETSAIMANLATMMTTPDHESPVPVYFTTTKPLFRPNHQHNVRHPHHNHRNKPQKSKQKFVAHPSGGDGESNDEIDEILLLNSTTAKPIMDIQRLRPVKPLRSSSSKEPHPQPTLPQQPPPKPKQQQPLVPVRRPEIKWRPYYQRTKNITRGEPQPHSTVTNTSTSLVPPPSTTPVPKVVDGGDVGQQQQQQQPSLPPPPTMVNVTVDKEEEKTMMFLPIKTGGHVKHQSTRPHRPQLTEPYEYPVMNFEDEMLHLHHPPLLKASMAGSGTAQAFFNQLTPSVDGGDKKSASSVLQDSMIPAGLGLEQPYFSENGNNMLMSELFDRKFNLINEIYRKKSNDPNMVAQPPLVRTSADLIRLAAMKQPPAPMGASSSSLLANQIHPKKQQPKLLATTTLAGGTVAPPMANLQTSVAATTPMPPPEVYVTIENKFYVLRNKTATVHHPIQDLNTVDDDKDIVPLLAPVAPPISASGTPTLQQPSPLSIVSSTSQVTKPHHVSSALPHRFNNHLDAANFFSSQRIPLTSGQSNGQEETIHHHNHHHHHHHHSQQQRHPVEEFPETLMQFMQKYHHQQQPQPHPTISGSGKKLPPPLMLSSGAGVTEPPYPFIPTIYGNNRRPLPMPSRVNKFNDNLLLNDPSSLMPDSGFNHRHHTLRQLDNGGDTSNNNPYTLVRHYIQTYFPDKAEIAGLVPEQQQQPGPSMKPMQNGNLMFWPMTSSTMLKADHKQTSSSPSPPLVKSNLYNGGEDSQETPTNLNQIMAGEDPLSVAMMLVSTGPNRYTDHKGLGVQTVHQSVAINDASNDGITKMPTPPRRRPSFDFETREQARLKQWSLTNAVKTGVATNQIIGGADHHHHRHKWSSTSSSSSSSSSSEEQQGPSSNDNNKMIFDDDDGQPELVFTSAEIDNGKPSSASMVVNGGDQRNKRPVMIDHQNGQTSSGEEKEKEEEEEEEEPSMTSGNGQANNKLGSMEDELLWKTMAQTPDPFDEFYDRDRSFLLPLNNNSLIDYSEIQWKPAASNQMEITTSLTATDNNNNNNNVTIVDQQLQQQQQDDQHRPQLLLPELSMMPVDKGIDSNHLPMNNGIGNGNGNNKNNNGGWGHPPKLSKLSELLSLNGLFNAIQNQNVKSLNQTTLSSSNNPNHHHHHHQSSASMVNDGELQFGFKRQPLSLATMLVPAATTAGRDVTGKQRQKQPSSLLLRSVKKPATTIKTIATANNHNNGPQATAVTKLMASFSARPLQPTSAISSMAVHQDDGDDLENNELIHKIGAKFSVGGNAPISSLPSPPPPSPVPIPVAMVNHHHQHHLNNEDPSPPPPPPTQLIGDGDLHYDVVQNLLMDHHHQHQPPSSFHHPTQPLWESSSMLNNQIALPFLTIEPNTNRIRKNRVLKNMKLLIKAINRIYRM